MKHQNFRYPSSAIRMSSYVAAPYFPSPKLNHAYVVVNKMPQYDDIYSDSFSSSPDPLSICVKKGRPLGGNAEVGVIISSILVIKVRGVEKVEALQGTFHRQTEAG